MCALTLTPVVKTVELYFFGCGNITMSEVQRSSSDKLIRYTQVAEASTGGVL